LTVYWQEGCRVSRPHPLLLVVAVVSLSNHDGSAATLVDTNIWVECVDPDIP
jgi:hypothetical protein